MARKPKVRAEIPKPGSVSFEDRVTKGVPYEWGYGSTPRTASLRDSLYWKSSTTKEWINVAAGIGKCTFREGQEIKIDLDRARLVTRAYRETEGQPWAIRKAKAVEKLCAEMPIFIKPGELIVGDANGAPDEIRWYPETSAWWMPEGITTGGFSQMVSEEERKEIIEDICEYWKERSVGDRIRDAMPDFIRPLAAEQLGWSLSVTSFEESRTVPAYDYEPLFEEGLQARIDKVEAKLRELEDRIGEMDPAEYLEKRHQWQAMALCGRAMIRYAQRLAELARQQAEAEKDETRKKELAELADILDWVPANPPRTFHECLQFNWIVEITGHFFAHCGNGSGARLDQLWWPYYEADMKEGRISREKALELVECLFLKIQDLGSPPEWPVVFSATSGFDIGYTFDICGSDGYGKDASNDLSCIIMEALANLHVNQPPPTVRYHRNISPDVVERAIDLNRMGMGHPSWHNEDLLEKWALMRGWPPEDAKRAQAACCIANNIPGKVVGGTGNGTFGALFAVKLLEEILGLFEVPDVPGRPELADPRQMRSADEILDAYCERLSFNMKIAVNVWNLAQQIIMEYSPDPCNSFLMDEAVERGVDLTQLHKEHDTWPITIFFGGINVADSLSAIQKLVFDDGKYTMDQLLEALRANWDGHEAMRQDFLSAPKYGNDDDYADEWAVKTLARTHDTVSQVVDAWGSPVTLDGSMAAGFQSIGLGCGASPDGRLGGTPLSDGTLSPMLGADRSGPTAVLNSIGKIPFMHTQLLNQRFIPQFLEGENKKLFAAYLQEWHAKGTIPHIQFNVVDNQVLRDAQEHPEKCANLQVRVAGYSAFWIDLAKETQDAIIARTEQSLGC
jgi:pyruvate formate-lyase/glycerol dehydratase family glycyl radical enzyme